jgi:branched-chain amino acid transport system ATP-binding protein
MLIVEGISVSYDEIPALHDVSIKVERGGIFSVIGSNGAGKSTLLKTIAGLVKPSKGRILFEGEDISTLPASKIVNKGICYVPEGRGIFSRMSVLDNLLVGAYSIRSKSRNFESINRLYNMFPILKERKNQSAGTLSGGEQQQLVIARGLMASPKILMLDEPSLGVGPLIVKSIFEFIREINQKESLTILLVEQNVKRSLSISHYGYILQTGRIVHEAPGQDLLQLEDIKKAYLGM